MKVVSGGNKYSEEKSAVECDRVTKWATSGRVIREDLQEEVAFRLRPDDEKERSRQRVGGRVSQREEDKQKP